MKLDPLDRTAIARHQSPDGELVWRVERSDDAAGGAVFSAGFEGGFWHVHPDQLERTGEPLAVLLKVTEQLLTDRLIIVEERRPVPDAPGEISLERRPLGNLDFDLQLKENDENWKLRLWSGRVITIEDVIDGKVDYEPLDLKMYAEVEALSAGHGIK